MKFLLTKIISNLIYMVTKDYSSVGLYILKTYPRIISSKTFNYKKGIVLITGSDGKSITSNMVSAILKSSKLKVNTNSYQENSLEGLIGCLFLDLNLISKMKSDVAVVEIREKDLGRFLHYIDPKVLVLLNLSILKTELDEDPEMILSDWIDSLENLSKKTTLVIDSTQPILNLIRKSFKGEVLTFNSFPTLGIHTKEIFNTKNINATVKVSSFYKVNIAKSKDIINNFVQTREKTEYVKVEENDFAFYFVKNALSFNATLEMLFENSDYEGLVIIKNRDLAQNSGVSWFYHTDPDYLNRSFKRLNMPVNNVFLSGNYCYEVATRLMYAQIYIPYENINKSLLGTLMQLRQSGIKKCLFAVMTDYGSFLELKKLVKEGKF